MATFNSYISAHGYLRRITGLKARAQSMYVGNLGYVGNAGMLAGATSLPLLAATTVNLSQYDDVYLFDGANTEMVQVTATTNAGATSIPITATTYAHLAGVSYCTDGTSGSLGQAIIEGCNELETITRHSLLQATYTNELLPLVSTRAWVDSSMRLTVRPRQFPVQSVSAISLIFDTVTMSLNLAQAEIDSVARFITIPTIKTVAGNGNTLPLNNGIGQATEGFAQITYVAGYVYSALPPIIKRAATLLISDILGDEFNPTGAASLHMGKRSQEAFLRGDNSGESALVKRARHWLKPYTQDAI